MNPAQALFAPRAIALVGASGDAAKNTARPLRFLRKHGYAGRIVPINPSRSEVLGERAWPSLAEAPEGIDHAFIMTAGDSVELALEECGSRGIAVATIFSGGFADAGPEGAARQQRLVARARALGVRLLGPNSMGVIDVPGKVALSVNAVLEMDALPEGTTSFVSQSGTMLGTVLSRGAARGLGFAKLVSVGNEADLGVGELVDLLAEDAGTRVILLFLETVRDSARLAAAARNAHAAGKPVVAYKLGRSRSGAALARSHSGALAGGDSAVDAYFRDCGIVRVDMLETLFEIAPLLAGRTPPHAATASRPPRVAVVTTTGGGAASVVDRMGMLDLETLAPDDALRARLAALGVSVSDSPIVDLTLGPASNAYGAVLQALLDSPACDAVLAVVGSSAQFHPRLAVEPILAAGRGGKPLAAFLTPHAERSLALLAGAGIAAFRTPEACADALAAFFRWRAPSAAHLHDRAASPEWPEALPQKGRLDEAQALALFRALGVPVAESALARPPGYEHALTYPVALKVLSPDVAHKTEAGGVALGISGRGEYDRQVRALLDSVAAAHPAARVEGVLVQRMEAGLAEVIVGYRDDALVGPVVLVGAGGTLAEIYQDFALRMAPVSEEEAAQMIGEVKGLAAIRGYRNLPRGDLRAVAVVVAALSRLALVPGLPVAEAEINPLIVKRAGAVAVDGLVVLEKEDGMDFRLTPGQEQFRESVRRFAQKHLAQGARERAHAAGYPWEVATLMAAQGLLGITIAEADGGQGGTLMDAVIAIETVASVCPRSADVVQAGNFGAIRVLAEYGSPLQKERHLKRLLSGDAVICVGMTEPEAGSAVTDLKTAATPDGEGYRVNGSKVFTTHAPYAEVILAYVRFGPGVGGIGSVLIDASAPGVRLGKRSMFMSGEEWAQLYFEDVYVPAEMVVLKEGGFKKQIAGFNVERIGNTARSLALGRYAYEAARQWAMQRKQFGRLLCEFQGVQWKFADMRTRLDAGELLLYRAASNADRGFPSAEETAIAKAYCNQAGFDVASEALQVMGGLGYSQEELVEYCLRRCRGWMIAGGSIQILKNRIAEGVFGRSFSQRPEKK